jgi:hypothetical protein
VTNRDAPAVWQRKVNLLEIELAMAVDPEQKHRLRELLLEARDNLVRLHHAGGPSSGSADVAEDKGVGIGALFDAVSERADEHRESLSPRSLPRIPRSALVEKHERLASRLACGEPSAVFVFGDAGCGKSTALGELYDRRTSLGAKWSAIIPASELEVGERPSSDELDRGLGRVAGTMTTLSAACGALVAAHGIGLVLVDTIDLFLNRQSSSAFLAVVGEVLRTGATVVASSRTEEFRTYIDANKRDSNDPWPLSTFEPEEMRLAARLFATQRDPTSDGEAFATRLWEMTAGETRLDAIARQPLLLSMMCDLFASDGHVPADLTVGALYQRYWVDRIDRSRRHNSVVAHIKERLCLRMGERLLDKGTDKLARSDLVLDPDIEVGAFDELVSDGMLQLGAHGSVRFFHQTFLEYATARWLCTLPAEAAKAKLLAGACAPDDELSGLTRWPVLRQLLAVVDEAEYRTLLARLPLSRIVAFRNAALAAGTRVEPTALDPLLSAALRASEEHRRQLLGAFESALSQQVGRAIEAAIALLLSGSHDSAVNSARTLGLLCRRHQDGQQVRSAIRAIESCGPSRDKKETFLEVLGCFLAGLQGAPLSSEVLQALVESVSACNVAWEDLETPMARIVGLHLVQGSEPDARLRLFRLLQTHSVNGELIGATAELGWMVRAEDLTRSLSQADVVIKLLTTPGATGWSTVWAKIVGRLVLHVDHAMGLAVADFLSGAPNHVGSYVIVFSEAMRLGARDKVAQALVRISPGQVTKAARKALANILRELLRSSDQRANNELRDWATALGHEKYFERTLAANEGTVLDPAALVSAASSRADRSAARGASRKLLSLATEGGIPDLHSFIELVASPWVEVRKNTVEALTVLGRSDRLDAESLAVLEALIVREREPQVLQQACEMISVWATNGATAEPERIGPRVPPVLVRALGVLVERKEQGAPMSKSLALSVLSAITSVARYEPHDAHAGFATLVASVIRAIPLQSVRGGESAAMILLPATARFEPRFLEQLVEMGDTLPKENSRALAVAVAKCHGNESPLLERIAASPWCSTEALDFIQRVRGA